MLRGLCEANRRKKKHEGLPIIVRLSVYHSILNPHGLDLSAVLRGSIGANGQIYNEEEALPKLMEALRDRGKLQKQISAQRRTALGDQNESINAETNRQERFGETLQVDADAFVTKTKLAEELRQSHLQTLKMVNQKFKIDEMIRKAKHDLTHTAGNFGTRDTPFVTTDGGVIERQYVQRPAAGMRAEVSVRVSQPLELGTSVNREVFMRNGKRVTRTTTRTRRLISPIQTNIVVQN